MKPLVPRGWQETAAIARAKAKPLGSKKPLGSDRLALPAVHASKARRHKRPITLPAMPWRDSK
jgi:hypothetical protein